MKNIHLSEFLALALIAVVSIAGITYLNSYSKLAMAAAKNQVAVVQPVKKVAVAPKQPTVLGAETVAGLSDSTETGADINWQSAKSLPSQINKLYKKHCLRPASFEELDKWMTKTVGEIETALTSNPLVNCQ